MGRKRHGPEEIIGKLRGAEVLIARGATAPALARRGGVPDHAGIEPDRQRAAFAWRRVDPPPVRWTGLSRHALHICRSLCFLAGIYRRYLSATLASVAFVSAS